MIIRVAFTLLLASFAMAQTGLAAYGVLLGGTASAPIIVNNSGHRILAYTLLFDRGNGASNPSVYSMLGQLRKQPMSSVGIAPGTSVPHQSFVETRNAAGQTPTVTAVALDSVLFGDGALVGPDKAGSFDQLTARVQAEKDVHAILVAQNGAAPACTILAGIASGQTVPAVQPSRSQVYQRLYLSMSKTYAAELLNVRSRAGDAAALDLARSSARYPTIVKTE